MLFICPYSICYYWMIINNHSTVKIKPSVEAVNQPSTILEFRNRTLDVSDLTTIISIITDISFISCCSKEWVEIGKRIATLPQLKTLTTDNCDSEDSLCVSICNSKSLTSIRMGNICVTQRTAAFPTKESNNYLKFSS
jgi:hypothetical protein